ncbi:hypothetical protein EJ066_20360 [Mesorhizobium sp. M9A.F.Ca.ET.002.03.1.2]|uniref:hypothetical protein n=1 Tax=Mesorhizobium sp. M9A.F.Ca.ET.002.03.1.2 TaxID=2493668 RepID=UPI000F76111D|nr:hypothetical protein [Mesorhizobium sp. M9A.F.Ca.ET.002.03.1.2]AZN99287.1 hypothetical protein EJ066_20360 [Mesorhizobium sp. M9A.F.Ca.ET.002.03.1.2]
METRDWYAWINTMPPKPDDFHVIGEVYVGNPGVEGFLAFREPQGINNKILLLDLHLVQRPGMWPQVMTWVQARYDSVIRPDAPEYTDVEIFFEAKSIAKISVEIVH